MYWRGEEQATMAELDGWDRILDATDENGYRLMDSHITS